MKRLNIWKISSVVLVALFIIFLIFGRSQIDDEISASQAKQIAEDFINNNLVGPDTTVTIDSITEKSGVYELNLIVNSLSQTQKVISYISKDGKKFFIAGIDLDELENQDTTPTSIPKADKPEIELYIFSYCPAGSSTLDSFAPVAELFKDKADLKVRFFSDMHGAHELQQNKIQECIQDIDPDKYWGYATDFFENIYSICGPTRDAECDESESIDLMKTNGIDSTKVLECVEDKGAELYNIDQQKATILNLRYSPSFVINGVWIEQISRSPEGIKMAICSAFNEEPEECEQSLSQQSQSAGNC